MLALHLLLSRLDNRIVLATNPWERRIARAEELAATETSAGEVLRFLALVLRLQKGVWRKLERASIPQTDLGFGRPIWAGAIDELPALLEVTRKEGPLALTEAARRLGEESRRLEGRAPELWVNKAGESETPAEDFFARALLQPYAEFVRSRGETKLLKHTPHLCPFCNHKPVAGVLRQVGDGGQRSLLCSLCFGEWVFRRIVCPACGEENSAKLPVYCAGEFAHLRVECCDTCKTYIKTVDLTKNGLAEPLVDEIAAIPLDLWAQEHGYSKLQVYLMQL